jgi:hypothetical protein
MYSTTYAAEIVKLISIAAMLFGFDVDASQLEVTLGLLAVILSSAWTLYQRYKAGGVNAFGLRR